MTTPTRSLPSSSPSSSRLRRLAPSPVKVPRPLACATPPHFPLPRPAPPARPAPASRHSFYQSPPPPTPPLLASEDPFEYDPHPTAASCVPPSSSSSADSELPASPSPVATASRAWDRAALAARAARAVPLVYDAAGTYARLARYAWEVLGPDVPEWADERCGRTDEVLLSPPSYYARFEPAPVLVAFRDVFGPAADARAGSPRMPHSAIAGLASALPPLPPLSPLSPADLDLPSFTDEPAGLASSSSPTRGARLDVSGASGALRLERDGSCGTFGPPRAATPDRRPSTDTMATDEDGWTYSLSAYGDDRVDPTPPLMPAPTFARLALPDLGYDDECDGPDGGALGSPASAADTELITPEHDDVDLPSRNPSVCSSAGGAGDMATPTPTPRGKPRSASGALGLSLGAPAALGLADLAPPSAVSDLCPSPSATLVPSPAPTPVPTPAIYLMHSRHGTPYKALPSLPRLPRAEYADAKLSSPSLSPTPAATPTTAQHAALPATPTTAASLAGADAALAAIDRELTVQLWVDQEGAREVRSTLRFVRTHRADVFRARERAALDEAAQWCESPRRPEPFQQSGCVEYGMDPKQRDKWIFHHGPLESLPVLRRLTINGDDKYDYLAREATLQIKDPGVYAVTGAAERGRAEWQFSYLVTPRISGRTGELIPNEKIVVPLALHVAPTFFDAERASKAHLYHVLKKSLAANVAAVKVRPPHVGKPPAGPAPEPLTKPAPSPPPHPAPSPPSPAAAQPVISRTIGALAKVMSSGSGAGAGTAVAAAAAAGSQAAPQTSTLAPAAVHKFGYKPASSVPGLARAGRLRTPTGLDSELAAEDERGAAGEGKGRRRARSLFSRQRPSTSPVNASSVPPLPSLASAATPAPPAPPAPPALPAPVPRRLARPSTADAHAVAARAPAAQLTRQRSATLMRLRGHAPSASLSDRPRPRALAAPHPFATQVIPVPSPGGQPPTPSSAQSGGSTPRALATPTAASPRTPGAHASIPPAQTIIISRSELPWDGERETLADQPLGHAHAHAHGHGHGYGHDGHSLAVGRLAHGLSPAPRAVRKRPSTAEPRIGMGAFGARARV